MSASVNETVSLGLERLQNVMQSLTSEKLDAIMSSIYNGNTPPSGVLGLFNSKEELYQFMEIKSPDDTVQLVRRQFEEVFDGVDKKLPLIAMVLAVIEFFGGREEKRKIDKGTYVDVSAAIMAPIAEIDNDGKVYSTPALPKSKEQSLYL
ncbi:MAG: hypothetical protein H6908_02895 [Hyphomicrobiales bacterium]|nr:hypothetical protein [Hyphomicrobiales bacterium]